MKLCVCILRISAYACSRARYCTEQFVMPIKNDCWTGRGFLVFTVGDLECHRQIRDKYDVTRLVFCAWASSLSNV